MPIVRTSIEQIRRRDLVEAAYLTFLEHGMQGLTMARIGERAGMSHGIVNYYFKSKDALVSAVVRKANFMIMQDTARRLRAAHTPRERVSAIIRQYGAERIIVAGSADWGVSDPLALVKVVRFLQQDGHDEQTIERLVRANAMAFYSQSPHWKPRLDLEPVDPRKFQR